MPLIKPSFLLTPLLASILLVCQQFAYGNNTTLSADPVSRNNRIGTDTLPVTCSKTPEIEKIIGEAISMGAPIYNQGLHMACYRIYEWAGYKILYEYGKDCKEVEKILKTAIEKSHGDFSDTEKAWLMRAAFDKILGEPTRTGQPEKPITPSQG
jgi:hypothetical protein